MKTLNDIRHVVVLVHPYSTLLSTSAPIEVFQNAIENMGWLKNEIDFSYKLHVISALASTKIDMKPGISINCECSYHEITYPIDTLIVIGSPRRNGYDKNLLLWLKRQSKIVRRICSLCAGAFILAEAGILSNKAAVTHWQLCEELASVHPDIYVNQEAIFIKQGNVYTSAGVTAGIDLSLALIEEDLGKSFALRIAKLMVLFLKRPGNQTQYSMMLQSQNIDYRPIKKITSWIHDHLYEDITVEKLAGLSSMSPRNFARVFVRELNIIPIKYVEKLRVEAACRHLTDTRLTINEVANLSGLKNSLNMNRVFLKAFNVTPSQFRKNFSSAFITK